ncbi:MAG: hypothetical protein AUJ52_00270 [Elusimicrobia bacterium CG1_02_63_36]|nr:MAG: hypothetical protein AUJ52_00270 [Elusimicrobia bacterium CG1_02_63_36]PJB26418.1 MAG: hypothetical protein CO113_03585 [Elusimicrobia bacterium CG_4_9_14_3_um_filter_62_55]
MSLLIFGKSHPIPGILWVFAAAAFAALSFGLVRALNEDFGTERLFGKPHERFWAGVSLLAAGVFLWTAFHPFLPGRVFGMRFWPVRFGQGDLWLRALVCAASGTALFAVASGVGLAGGFWGWRPVLGPGFKRALLQGAGIGACVGAFSVYACRALFLAEAMTRIGYGELGPALLWAILPLFLACAVLIVVPIAADWMTDRWQIVALGAGLATAWVVPVELGEAYLRVEWNYGPVSLAEAAGIPSASEAPKAGTLILSDAEGNPGRQYGETLLASQGISVSRESLRLLEIFLEKRAYRTMFLPEALAALRRGWLLQWDADRHLDAAALRVGGRFPPDYKTFLAAIRSAPVSEGNLLRLDRVAEDAKEEGFGQVKTAQRMFEGFSAAYARFGDLERSNQWLDRIRGLWPLFEDDIHIEPIEENFDGWIGGRLLYNGKPASGIRVGLFTLPSTMTVIGAYEGLVGSTLPGEDGEFAFDHLPTGRYYLALRADPLVLGNETLALANAPGVIPLRYGELTQALPSIELGARSQAGTRKPPPRPPGRIGLKSLPGLQRSR